MIGLKFWKGNEMKYRIHYTMANGDDDYIIVEADTQGELDSLIYSAIESRGAFDPWSEEIE